MALEKEFRIKELALNKDGTNIWFYPQILIINRINKGMLWWKKEVVSERYSNFFKQKDYSFCNSGYTYCRFKEDEHEKVKNIVAFRDKSDAEIFIKDFFEVMKKYYEEKNETEYKEIGALYEGEEVKTHPVNI